jgi:transcriptional regulator with XRE-family HTH domain
MNPLLSLSTRFDSMTQDEKAFFQQLGARIAELRKSATITQVQLADTLGVSQQTVASWEVGRRGVPIATLPALARALSVSVETLIGEKAAPAKRGPAPQLQQRIERLTRLPKAQQRLVLQMLDGVLSQTNR